MHVEDESIFCASDTNFWCKERTCFALMTNASVLEMNTFKKCVQTLATKSYTCGYQQLSNRIALKISTHRFSPLKTGSSHTLVITCDYATPTSCMCNGVLCWNKHHSR